MLAMESSRIARLLQPFAGAELAPDLLGKLDVYLELLMLWNARVNLTAIRDPEQIVTRHFGESLFAARQLFDPAAPPLALADVGSGAGFPGVPMKLWSPHLRLTLIESQNKKATFLREVIRALELPEAEVFCGRAEQWGKQPMSSPCAQSSSSNGYCRSPPRSQLPAENSACSSVGSNATQLVSWSVKVGCGVILSPFRKVTTG